MLRLSRFVGRRWHALPVRCIRISHVAPHKRSAVLVATPHVPQGFRGGRYAGGGSFRRRSRPFREQSGLLLQPRGLLHQFGVLFAGQAGHAVERGLVLGLLSPSEQLR